MEPNVKVNRASVAREELGSGVVYTAGLYEHPTAKDENGNPIQIGTRFDPLFGDAQSEAVGRLGFVRVGDLPEDYLVQEKVAYSSTVPTAPVLGSVDADVLKGLNARMGQLEAENAALKAAGTHNESEVAAIRDGVATVAAVHANEVALDAANSAPPVEDAPVVKPVEKMNKAELLDAGAELGLELDPALTNKQLVEAIKTAQSE